MMPLMDDVIEWVEFCDNLVACLLYTSTMQYITCDVVTICVGLAASFGAFLLAGGAHGKRMALPHAEIMIHQPAIHGQGIHCLLYTSDPAACKR